MVFLVVELGWLVREGPEGRRGEFGGGAVSVQQWVRGRESRASGVIGVGFQVSGGGLVAFAYSMF